MGQLTLTCSIDDLNEAHPIIHNKLFAIRVFYCGVVRLIATGINKMATRM